jgi:hypothetical protein
VLRSARATEIHSRRGSRSARSTGTQATLSARPAPRIQDRSRTVFPLPAGADIWTTRSASRSRRSSGGRATIPFLSSGMTRTSAVSGWMTGDMALLVKSTGLLLRKVCRHVNGLSGFGQNEASLAPGLVRGRH